MSREDAFWSDLVARMRKCRETYGYTQAEVADKVGLSEAAYKSYENGNRRIPVDALTRVAALYNVSVDELLGNAITRDNAPTHSIQGNFTKEQLEKIQKYASLVLKNEL